MKKHWKVGEVAALTGLTIRTLRYYDQIDLFSPSSHTPTGHRLYNESDLNTLQQILALKQIGLALDEIKSIITRNETGLTETILETQINRVKKEIDIQQHLLQELEMALTAVRRNKKMSVEEMTNLLSAMRMSRSQYFSQGQLEQMKKHYEAHEEASIQQAEQDFEAILQRIRLEKERGTPPTDQKVQVLARQWSDIVYSFTGYDQKLQKQAEQFHADHPGHALQYGITPEIYQYIQEALA